MKKLFFALMVAAAALMSSCGTPEEPNKGGNNDEFYGYEMNYMDITAIGEDQYIFQMSYDLYDPETEKYVTTERMLSALVTIPGVNEDLTFPAGTYPISKGGLSENGYYIIGSWYRNNVSDSPYIMSVNNGQLVIEHNANGYRVTALVNGVNVDTDKAVNGIECRYEGDVEGIYGNLWTAADTAYAEWGGTTSEGVSYWTLNLYTQQGYMFDLAVNTEAIDAKDIAKGIPSGTYTIDFGAEPGTMDPFYYDGQSVYGSTLGIIYEGYYYWQEGIVGGKVEIVNDGNGNYTIDMQYYNNNFVPYEMHFEGTVEHADGTIYNFGNNFDVAMMEYYGDGLWSVVTGISAYDYYFYLNFITEGQSFADGIPSGTYTCNASGEANTILAGIVDAEGYYKGGSLFADSKLTALYDIFAGGTVEVTNNGNGAYKLDMKLEGGMDITYYYNGVFSGKAEVADASTPEGGEEGGETTEPASVKALKSNKVQGLNSGKKVALENNDCLLLDKKFSLNR